jgi:hypothetical protein
MRDSPPGSPWRNTLGPRCNDVTSASCSCMETGHHNRKILCPTKQQAFRGGNKEIEDSQFSIPDTLMSAPPFFTTGDKFIVIDLKTCLFRRLCDFSLWCNARHELSLSCGFYAK